MNHYFNFVFKYAKKHTLVGFLIKNTTCFIYISLLAKLQLFINTYEHQYLTKTTFLIFIIGASSALILIELLALATQLAAYKKATYGLQQELSLKASQLSTQTPSVRGRAISHIVDTIMEPATWLSIPSRLLVILITLWAFNLPLLWPLICSAITLALTFILSRYQYQFAKQTVNAINRRSKILQRFVKRQRTQSTYLRNKIDLIFRKELLLRDKSTIIEELSQQTTLVTSLLCTVTLYFLEVLSTEELLIFTLSTGMIASTIAESAIAIGNASKTSTFFNLLTSEKECDRTIQLWAGSLASNTLMYDNEDQCHQLFKALFGIKFLEKHQDDIAIEQLSTAQKNTILTVRTAWLSKSAAIPEKYQHTMDNKIYSILLEQLQTFVKPA